MRRTKWRWRLVAVLSVASAMVTAACHGSVHAGGGQVAKHDVEAQVSTQLAAAVNQPAPKITCPSGLSAKVGASVDCDLTTEGDPRKFPVHVVVDSVDHGTAHFTATVGRTPG